ncbi:MAG: hypothetical protein QXV81_07595 [Ignisphaera sp.]
MDTTVNIVENTTEYKSISSKVLEESNPQAIEIYQAIEKHTPNWKNHRKRYTFDDILYILETTIITTATTMYRRGSRLKLTVKAYRTDIKTMIKLSDVIKVRDHRIRPTMNIRFIMFINFQLQLLQTL